MLSTRCERSWTDEQPFVRVVLYLVDPYRTFVSSGSILSGQMFAFILVKKYRLTICMNPVSSTYARRLVLRKTFRN